MLILYWSLLKRTYDMDIKEIINGIAVIIDDEVNQEGTGIYNFATR